MRSGTGQQLAANSKTLDGSRTSWSAPIRFAASVGLKKLRCAELRCKLRAHWYVTLFDAINFDHSSRICSSSSSSSSVTHAFDLLRYGFVCIIDEHTYTKLRQQGVTIQTLLSIVGKTARLTLFADAGYAVDLQRNTLCLCLVLLCMVKRTTVLEPLRDLMQHTHN
jgi:hypothetical protein